MMTPSEGSLGLPPEVRANPYPFYEQLRAQDPVLWVPGILGRGAWLITGHHECSALLKENQFGKEAHKVVPEEQLRAVPFLVQKSGVKNMLFRDPPDHTRLRGLVSQAFTPRMLERLRPRIHEIAEGLIADMKGQREVDLIGSFAFALPIIVIAEMLGVPAADREQFKTWSNPLTASVDPTATPEMLQEAQRMLPELTAYLERIIEERRHNPGPDLISSLIAAHEAGDKLDAEELVATCRLLLIAGHETTVNLIGNGMLALLRNPEQREWLAANPDKIGNAVEELLRYDSPVQLTMRVAFEDLPVGNQTVKKGDQVVTLLGGGNRDPRQYADPSRLDLTRKNASTHVAFGQGIHYCLGAPLARIEGQIAINALLEHFPQMALATEELTYRRNITLRGVQSLPVKL
jgi:pimeloyl-[acyl-carrier protein] synthase